MLRSTLIYGPAILVTRLSALLLLLVATRLLSQDEYGLLTLVVTVGEMTDLALANWLRISLLRLGGRQVISRGSVRLAAGVLALATLAGLGVAVMASLLVAPERWVEFAIAVGVYILVGAASRFGLVLLQMQQRQAIYSMVEFVRASLQLVLPVAVMLATRDSFLMVSLAASAGALVAGVLALWLALSRVVLGPPRFTARELLMLGIPLIVMAILGFGLNSVERVLLKLYYDAGAVAIFAAAYALARQPIDTVANAINMGAFPEMVSRHDQEGPAAAAAYLSRQLAMMGRLCLPVAALLVALGADISELLLPVEYHRNAGVLFPLIALGVLFTSFAAFSFENVFHAHKRPWLLILSMTPAALTTIALSVVLIPGLAEVGAALALSGGAGLNLLTSIVLSRRLTPVPIPYRDLLNSTGVAVATGCAAWLVSASLGEAGAFFKLALGGTSGLIVFLGLQTLLHPSETLALAQSVRKRLKVA